MSEEVRKLKTVIARRTLTALVVLFVIASATYSWFTMNKEVNGRGMSITVEAGPVLVIEKDASLISTSEKSSVDFVNTTVESVYAATHSWTNIDSSATGNQTGLIYVKNPMVISADTGLAKNGSNATFANVPVRGTGDVYYKDYLIYVASRNEAMTVTSFSAELDWYNAPSVEDKGYLNAASIDFYVSSVSETNYRGTLNLAGVDYRNNGNTLKSIDLVPEDYTMSIPLSTEGFVTLVMRCYFDGGLLEVTDGTLGDAFVHAAGLELKNFGMRVKFDVVRQ